MSLRRVNLGFRYMWTAWLSLLRWLALGATLVFMGIAVVTKDTTWLVPVAIAGGVCVVLTLMFMVEAPAVRCLGCGGTLLRPMNCAKHKTAKRILGSYTLHCTLALSAYAKSVHCPYCGMRYRISRATRAQKRREEDQTEARLRAETAARESEAKAESEAKNVPYY